MKYLVILFLSLGCLSLFAQSTYLYGYDNAGNRIQREMIPLRLSNPNAGNMPSTDAEASDRQATELQGLNDQLDNKVSISLFPNPTANEVNLEFNKENHLTEEVRIINSRGKLLYQDQFVSGNFALPFNNLVAGSYFIWLKINGSIYGYQVIKE
tara:strand:+ start:2362 stop:2823 length:462 start_codon:yes stop_codon:yes gene_type:complete